MLDRLDARGIRLWVEDGQLRYQARAGALDAPLRAEIAARKPDLMARLATLAAAAVPPAAPASPIVPCPADRFRPFPQTPIQEAYRVGRSEAMALGGVAAHSYVELERSGVGVETVARCLDEVITRHDMLRVVMCEGGQQRVLETVPAYEIATTDLTGLSESDWAAALVAIRREMESCTRDPGTWPLFEIRATRRGDVVRLHVSVDLIALDAFSWQLFFQEWLDLVDGIVPPPAPTLLFRDVLLSGRDTGAARRAAARAYWRDALPALPPAPTLPPPAAGTPNRFRRFAGRLEAPRWAAFKATCRATGVTPSIALCTVFANVLSRWSRNEDVALDVTLFNRPPIHPEIERVLGEFTDVTFLGFCGIERPLADQMRDAGTALLEHIEHGAVDGVTLLRELARLRGDFGGALMPVVFTSMLMGDARAARPISWRQVYGLSQTPQVALDHQVIERDGAMLFNWDISAAGIDLNAVPPMLAAYEAALDRLACEPEAWTQPLPRTLPGAQRATRAAVRAEAGAARIPAGPDAGLDAPFWAGLDARAERPAVIWSGGTLTHGALAERALALAARLDAAGVAPGDRVAIRLAKGPLQAVAVLAVHALGAAYVPIAPDQPAARAAAMTAQARPAAVISSRDGAGDAFETGLPTVAVGLDDPLDIAPAARFARRPNGPDDLAYVLFTSGSTGVPKGVAMAHGAVRNTIDDMIARFGFGPDDRVLALSALDFDLSVYDLFAPLAAGGAVVMPDPDRTRDPDHWLALLAAHRVTVWNSVPTFLAMLLAAWRIDAAALAGLRLVLASGDWMPLDLAGRLRRLAPAARLIVLGGATEAAIWSNAQEVETVPPQWRAVPYGRPLRGQHYRVLDRAGADRPDLVCGELHIGGAGLALGYWDDAERTAAAFVRHPADGERLYRTGDLGRFWPDGTLEFLGRADTQVKIGGHRVELGEIEHALESHPAVARAVAAVQAGGAPMLVAHVVPRPGATVEPEALRAHVQGLLPRHMVPRLIGRLAAPPLTVNGKIDRRALPVLAAAAPSARPASQLERRIAAVLGRLLGRADIPPDENFFELGATSVLLVEAHGRLRDELGVALSVTDLFAHPTLASLNAALAHRAAEPRPDTPPA
nr:amino acid adenylation domain-containing protein [Rhodoplanes tepidamans]